MTPLKHWVIRLMLLLIKKLVISDIRHKLAIPAMRDLTESLTTALILHVWVTLRGALPTTLASA